MKITLKTKVKRGVKRELFAELKEGMAALGDARQGKRALRTSEVHSKPARRLWPQGDSAVRPSA